LPVSEAVDPEQIVAVVIELAAMLFTVTVQVPLEAVGVALHVPSFAYRR
jgi:hypothetical protein